MRLKGSVLGVALCMVGLFAFLNLAWADDRADEVRRVQASADVLEEIMSAPDKGIPQEVMESAVCVGVVPGLKKGGFVFGAEYGKGIASCRTATGWSAPAPFKVVGGSWGLQIGGEAVDLVIADHEQERHGETSFEQVQIGRRCFGGGGPRGASRGRGNRLEDEGRGIDLFACTGNLCGLNGQWSSDRTRW